jgi:phosphoribosylformylglycinamidine synthase
LGVPFACFQPIAADIRPNFQEPAVPKIIVEVMPKADLLDPQGKAVANALHRQGHANILNVRIGKRIELHTAGVPTEAELAEAQKIADSFLSNGVIEDVVKIHVEN